MFAKYKPVSNSRIEAAMLESCKVSNGEFTGGICAEKDGVLTLTFFRPNLSRKTREGRRDDVAAATAALKKALPEEYAQSFRIIPREAFIREVPKSVLTGTIWV